LALYLPLRTEVKVAFPKSRKRGGEGPIFIRQAALVDRNENEL